MPATAATITAIIKNRVHENNSGARATEDVALLYKRIKEEPIKAKKIIPGKNFSDSVIPPLIIYRK